jgi:type II secretory ATPase GspE/PulE/Tfp pilus assembly ATPase PilB-like protein
MSFQIKKNNLSNELKAHDGRRKFNIDDPLSLEAYTIHIIVGSKGSGKTSLLLSMLKSKDIYRKHFNNIYLISPTAGTGHDPKMLKLVDELDKDGHFFTECNDDNYQQILDMIKESNNDLLDKKKEYDEKKTSHPTEKKKSSFEYRNLLILDDCLASMPRNGEKNNKLNEMVVACRHLHTNIILLVQKYNTIPTLIRNNTDYISFYPSHSRQEIQTLINDWSIDEKLFKQLLDFATSEKYSFLHINLLHDNKPLFFKKFDRILI